MCNKAGGQATCRSIDRERERARARGRGRGSRDCHRVLHGSIIYQRVEIIWRDCNRIIESNITPAHVGSFLPTPNYKPYLTSLSLIAGPATPRSPLNDRVSANASYLRLPGQKTHNLVQTPPNRPPRYYPCHLSGHPSEVFLDLDSLDISLTPFISCTTTPPPHHLLSREPSSSTPFTLLHVASVTSQPPRRFLNASPHVRTSSSFGGGCLPFSPRCRPPTTHRPSLAHCPGR